VGLLLTIADLGLSTPWGRHLVVREVNVALRGTFKGKLVIDRLGSLHLGHADGLDAHVEAPDGTVVLAVHGASARVLPLDLIASLLGHGDLRIDLFDAHMASTEVDLVSGPDGNPLIASAFELSTAPRADAKPGRSIVLAIPSVRIERTVVRHALAGMPDAEAELDDLRASVHVAPSGVEVDVSRVAVVGRGAPDGADPHGAVEAHLRVPAANGSAFGLNAAFRGDVGGVLARAHCTLDSEAIDADADVPEAKPEAMRALVAAWPVRRPVSAHVEGHGPWSTVQATAQATMGAARIAATGEVSLHGGLSATLTAEARDVDVADFTDGETHSDLSVHVSVGARTAGDGTLAGRFTVLSRAGTLAGQALPLATVTGEFEHGRRDDHVVAQGQIDEPGAPTSLHADITTATSPPRVTFRAASHVTRLDGLRALAGMQGSGDVHVAGSVTLERTPRLEAAVEANADHVARGNLSAEHARLAGSAVGPLMNPALSATLDAGELVLGRYRFREGHLETKGSLLRQEIDATLLGELSARAHTAVALGGAVDLEGASVALSRGGTELRVDMDRVRAGAGRVDIEGARVAGVGEPTRATLHLRPGSLRAQADSKGLDLKALGYVLGLGRTLRDGRVAFAVDVSARPDGADGSATVDVANGCFLDVDGLTGHLDARMAGREVTGALDAAATGLGSLRASGERVHVGGAGPLDLRAWRRVWGDIQMNADVDLGRVAALLPPNTLPVADAAGRVLLHGRVARRSESDLVPDMTLSIRTSGLRLGARGAPDRGSDGTVLVSTPPWRLSGVDVATDMSVKGGGLTELALRLSDARGVVVTVDAKSNEIPFARLLASDPGWADALARVPFKAQIAMPERSLESLPDILRPEGVTGTAQATLSVEGTCLRPSVILQGTARSVGFLDSGRRAPLDADGTLKYDGSTGEGEVDVRSSGQTLLRAVAQVNAQAASLLAGRAAWDASVQASLTRLPLSSIPVVSDRDVRGEVSGDIELTGVHSDARAKADLDLTGLRVGKTAYGKVHVHAGFDGSVLDATAELDEGDGKGKLAAKAGVVWRDRVLPAFDATQPADASLEASRLRIGILGPFIQGAIEQLDGRLDADARVAVAPGRAPTLAGSATLSDGTIALAPLGQELHSVRGKVTFEPGGIVRLADASAEGGSGKVGLSGLAHVAGTELVDANAELTIAKREAMPLAVEGTEVGTVYGKVDLKATASADRTLNLRVDVPSWHVELPEASTHGVQDLGAPPAEVHVGVYVGQGRFVQLAVDGAEAPDGRTVSSAKSAGPPLVTDVHLGNDVEIRRGTDLKVELDGAMAVKVQKDTSITGEIHLKGGTLDVQGKTFEIQGGTVTFVGDPANPMVRVTAAWSALDGTRVFADYLGPLKTGKVTLRSEPPRPQNEILALVMFGTADGSASTPYASPQPDAATKAGTTVGGFATGGLSKGLDKLTGMDITAKLDSSQANPRPEVEVQVAKDISLQLAFVLGTPPPGTNPDTTYATIDWRFLRNWSLETTFGNLGSSIADLVWQRRY
jgi:translocation and assembly module TamB